MYNEVRWPKLGSYFYRRGSHDYRVMTLRRGKITTITVDTELELRNELTELTNYLRSYPS